MTSIETSLRQMQLLNEQLDVIQKLVSIYKIQPKAAEKIVRSLDPSIKWKLYTLVK